MRHTAAFGVVVRVRRLAFVLMPHCWSSRAGTLYGWRVTRGADRSSSADATGLVTSIIPTRTGVSPFLLGLLSLGGAGVGVAFVSSAAAWDSWDKVGVALMGVAFMAMSLPLWSALRVLLDHPWIAFDDDAVTVCYPTILTANWRIPARDIAAVSWHTPRRLRPTATLGLSSTRDNLSIRFQRADMTAPVKPRLCYQLVTRGAWPGHMVNRSPLAQVTLRARLGANEITPRCQRDVTALTRATGESARHTAACGTSHARRPRRLAQYPASSDSFFAISASRPRATCWYRLAASALR